jgi:hypothetical protein
VSSPHRVHKLLSRDELDQLEAFARERVRSVKSVHEWLLAHGFRMSPSAARNWRRQFYAEDKVRRAAEVSRQYLDVAKEAGADQIAAASLQRFQTLLFDYLLKADDADAGELRKLALSLNTSVQAGRHIEELRKEYEARQRRAIEEAAKAAKSGGSGEAVVQKMREILGIKDAA